MDQQLQQIAQICSQNREINNFEIRSMFFCLASAIRQFIGRGQKKQGENNPASFLINRQYFDLQIKQISKVFDNRMGAYQELDEKIEKVTRTTKQEIQNQLQQRMNYILTKIGQQSEQVRVELYQRQMAVYQKIFQMESKLIISSEAKINQYIAKQVQKIRNEMKAFKADLIQITKSQTKKSIQYAQLISQKILPTSSKGWIDQECQYFNDLKIQNNQITVPQPSIIFGKKIIGKQYKFSVKIEKQQNSICLGLANQNTKASLSLLGLFPYIIFYSSQRCQTIGNVSKNNVGLGFKQGQRVTVLVDRQKGSIQWLVDNRIRNRVENIQMIKNNAIKWVPLIIFHGYQNIVDISQ